MSQQLRIAVLMTLATTVLFGLIYPLGVTGIAQLFFADKANGSLISRDGKMVGSALLGQGFSSPGYFRPRPSVAGDGYDGANSGGSNLAATNRQLIERVNSDVARLSKENPGPMVPVDLVTTSASGLDPDISPAAAEFQISRVARERGMTEAEVRALVARYTQPRQFGVLGEPRVNVLLLNLALDSSHPKR
ncbi:MAG: potassium-transporting ATPase subunit C [Proteobacteria bacterium]|nr:MAG: potassium-transporting ATPase subunit C [Pseudomonadota bacterium]